MVVPVVLGTGHLTGQTGRLTVLNPAYDLLPNGQRAYGSNLATSQADQDSPTGAAVNEVWAEMWDKFDLDDIKRRLNLCASLGMNTVRIPGTLCGITTGRITRSTYLNRWGQVLAACRERNLFAYPFLTDTFNDKFGTMNYTNIVTELVPTAAYLGTQPDIIGLDLVGESDTWRLGSDAKALYDAVKSVTDLPCTYSAYTEYDGTSLSNAFLADRVDFLDFHTYHDPTTGPLTNYWANGGNRPVMFGEYGQNQSESGPSQQARYNAVVACAALDSGGGKKLAGALSWSIRDYATGGPNAANQWGAYLLDGTTKRTIFTDILYDDLRPLLLAGYVPPGDPGGGSIPGRTILGYRLAGVDRTVVEFRRPATDGPGGGFG